MPAAKALAIRKILFPTDFSPASRAALDHALVWAELHDAELELLHVLTLRTADPFHPDHHFPEPGELLARLQTLAESEMKGLLAPHRERVLRITETIERDAEVDAGILERAQDGGATMIVMGTHGRRGPARLLIGSVASEVTRRATCPVLVVPARGTRPAGTLQRILAAVDFSASSRRAAAHARALALETGAALELFHVVPDLEVPLPMNPAGLAAPATLMRDLESAARDALSEMAEAYGRESRVTTEVWHGPAAVTILNRAEEYGADLIVVGAQGHGALDHLLLGSVAEKVARLARCPVLIVPAKGRSLLPEG